MAKLAAKNATILIGGYSLSTYAASYEVSYEANPAEVTGFGDAWKNYIPTMFGGQMSINMYWSSADNTTNEALQTLAKRHVTVIPQTYALGTPAMTMYAQHGAFTPQASPDGVLMVGNIVFQGSGVDAGPLPGIALQHGTITNTLTGTSFRDPSEGAVTQRCAGVLHVWTATATDTYVIKIQDSANDSDWADLVTFTLNGTAINSEMVQVASGTVDQYRRVLATRTGAAGDTLGFTVVFWHGGF